jgi:hypothetical protein
MAKGKSAPLGLQKSARAKSQAAVERASKAIKSLVARGLPIDFQSVAREGNVSVAFLYKNGDLKNNTAVTILKIAVLAPMPSASVRTATAANPGLRLGIRSA